MGKRESAWSTGRWGDFKIGNSSPSAVKDELENEMALWCADAMGTYAILIDGEEYDAFVTVKLQRKK